MGITLRLRLNGEGAVTWLPIAKAKLAAMNARPSASVLRTTLDHAEYKAVITRSPVVDSIEITTGQPYIFGYFIFAGAGGDEKVGNAQVDPESAIVRLLTGYKVAPQIGEQPPIVELARAPHVGDDFVFIAWSNRLSVGFPKDIVVWTLLNKLSAQGTQYVTSDPRRMGHSTTFIDVVQMYGTSSIYKSTNVWGSGWRDSTKRYGYGCCGLISDGTEDENPTPIVYVGYTGTQQIEQVAIPRAEGRVYFNYAMHVIGPGRLQAIQSVSDEDDPQIPPYFLQSNNHGDSWEAVPADFLIEYTYQRTEPGDRPRYSASQLTAFSQNSTIQYLGDGRQLLVLSAGLKDMLGPPLLPGGAAQPRYCYMLFQGNAGTGYSRIPWPADDWITTAVGSRTTDSYIPIFEPNAAGGADYMGMQMVYGKGCIHFTVVVGGVPQYMISRDFGATWEFHPRPYNVALVGVTLKPYNSVDDPGKLIFAFPDYPAGRIRFVTTDGKFNEFKKVGTSIKPKEGLRSPAGSLVPFNTVFVNYGGGRYPSRVFPALPNEFEPT